MARGDLVGLGQAYELRYIRTGETRQQTARFDPVFWWAWSGTPERGDMMLVRRIGPASIGVLNGQTRAMHIYFHGAAPTELLTVEPMIARPNTMHLIGDATAIAYDARGMASTKATKPYRHYFGDPGDERYAHGRRDCPELLCDEDGHLMLRRRATNRFRLAEWIID